jgi:hypothetical protein
VTAVSSFGSRFSSFNEKGDNNNIFHFSYLRQKSALFPEEDAMKDSVKIKIPANQQFTGILIFSGMDGTRTRDLLRDRQAF